MHVVVGPFVGTRIGEHRAVEPHVVPVVGRVSRKRRARVVVAVGALRIGEGAFGRVVVRVLEMHVATRERDLNIVDHHETSKRVGLARVGAPRSRSWLWLMRISM